MFLDLCILMRCGRVRGLGKHDRRLFDRVAEVELLAMRCV